MASVSDSAKAPVACAAEDPVDVHQFWHNSDGSDQLPTIPLASCMSVAASSHHRGIVWSFVTFSNLPDGVEARDARELLDEEALSIFPKLSLASDYLRVMALRKYGGWYLDMDCLVLPGKELPSLKTALRGFVGSLAPSPHRAPGMIAAVMGFDRPNHPLASVMAREVQKTVDRLHLHLKHDTLQSVVYGCVQSRNYRPCLLKAIHLHGNVMWWNDEANLDMWIKPTAASKRQRFAACTLSPWSEVEEKATCVHLSNSRITFDDSFLARDNIRGPFGRLLWSVLDAGRGGKATGKSTLCVAGQLHLEAFHGGNGRTDQGEACV